MSALELNTNNFDETVGGADRPVLIDFWAPWCGPCRMQSPIVEALSEELGDTAVVTKVNVDENPELAMRFGVMSIPTLVCMQNGKIADSRTGVTPKDALLTLLGLCAPGLSLPAGAAEADL